MFAVGREDTVEAGEVDLGFWHEGGEAGRCPIQSGTLYEADTNVLQGLSHPACSDTLNNCGGGNKEPDPVH